MATRTIDIDQSSADVADLLSEVREGNEILVTRGHEPIARIIPITHSGRRGGFGSLQGQIWMADDFDAPLTSEFEDGVA